MKKTLLFGIIYALIITAVFGSFFMLSESRVKHIVSSPEQIRELKCDGLCLIGLNSVEIYNNKLLTPDDFASGDTAEPDNIIDYDSFVTYRFTVGTVPGETYGFFRKKSDYAMNVYAGGVLIAKTGKVSAKADEFIPTAESPEGFFTAAGDKVEIIIQQANFNHVKHYDTQIVTGPARETERYARLWYIGRTVVFVSLVTAGLMNLGMYFFFENKLKYLFLAFLCLAGAVNYATPSLTDFVFQNISWYVSHRIEYCSKILIPFFAVAYADTVFEGGINKHLKYLFMLYSAACIAVTLLLPSNIYTAIGEAGSYILVALLLFILINLAVSIKKKSEETEKYKILIICGFVTLLIFSLFELLHISVGLFRFVLTETGIIIFAFINTVALALDFNEMSLRLDEAIMREKELMQTNETMVKLGNMRDSFLADLSHELKTPLTVIGNISALTAYQLKNGAADAKTVTDLEKAENEAVRLGRMVDNLKLKSITKFENNGEITENLSATLRFATDFCLPLCKRNNNKISVDCGENIKADISEDLVFHCLYNLISNASRHCKNSVIELSGRQQNGKAVIRVTDRGDGMTEEEKKKAFDRGYSGDSGSGIGLALCKEIAEDNGGSIELSDTPGGGLTVTITFNGC